MEENLKRAENMLRIMFETLQKADSRNIKERAKKIISTNISMLEDSENISDKLEVLKLSLEIINKEYEKFALNDKPHVESKEEIKEKLKHLQDIIDEDGERY